MGYIINAENNRVLTIMRDGKAMDFYYRKMRLWNVPFIAGSMLFKDPFIDVLTGMISKYTIKIIFMYITSQEVKNTDQTVYMSTDPITSPNELYTAIQANCNHIFSTPNDVQIKEYYYNLARLAHSLNITLPPIILGTGGLRSNGAFFELLKFLLKYAQ